MKNLIYGALLVMASPTFAQYLPPLQFPVTPIQPTTEEKLIFTTKSVPETPVPLAPVESQKEKRKEISLGEYRAARKRLFKEMRASESVFRKTGHWSDLTVSLFDLGYSRFHNELMQFTIQGSLGAVIKGFMIGASAQITLPQTYVSSHGNEYSLPHFYDVAFVLGYRIAASKGIGLRLTFHTGYGSNFPQQAIYSPYGDFSLKYVLLMPAINVDIKIYKSVVFTLGLAYQGKIFLNQTDASKLFTEDMNFNGFRALKISIGLGISY